MKPTSRDVDHLRSDDGHMGTVDPSNRKKYPSFFLKPICRKLQVDSKNVSPKIGSKVLQK